MKSTTYEFTKKCEELEAVAKSINVDLAAITNEAFQIFAAICGSFKVEGQNISLSFHNYSVLIKSEDYCMVCLGVKLYIILKERAVYFFTKDDDQQVHQIFIMHPKNSDDKVFVSNISEIIADKKEYQWTTNNQKMTQDQKKFIEIIRSGNLSLAEQLLKSNDYE